MTAAERGDAGRGERAAATAPRSRTCRGLTLVELLVVIAVIAMLAGLLVPAVQGARESARRGQCSSNQRQIALGLLGAEAANGVIPGWRNEVQASGLTIYPAWPVLIMPYIDRLDIHRAIGNQSSLAGYGSLTGIVQVFVCPSNPPSGNVVPLAYAGSCGSPSNAARFDGVMKDTTIVTGSTSGRISLGDVSAADGTSLTLLLAEKSASGNATGFVQGIWRTHSAAGGGFTFANGNADPYVPGVGLPGNVASKVINPAGLGNANADVGQINTPSSSHPMGAVVAFCDGRVSYLKETLRPEVYAQLMSWDHDDAIVPAASTYKSWVVGGSGTYWPVKEADLR